MIIIKIANRKKNFETFLLNYMFRQKINEKKLIILNDEI